MQFQKMNVARSLFKANVLLVIVLLFISGCLSKKENATDEKKDVPPVVVTNPPPQTKTPFLCSPKTDYEDFKCDGNFEAKTKAQLDEYLTNFGLEKNKFKDLEISFPIEEENLQIHSPCKIKLQKNLIIKAKNLCLDAKEGFSNEKGLNINIDNILGIVSEKGDIKLDNEPVIKATDFQITASDNIMIGEGAQILLLGNAIIETSAQSELKSKIIFSAANLNISSDKKLMIGEKASIAVVNQVNLDSKKCEIQKKAIITSKIKTGKCLGKSNSAPVMIGDQQFIGKKSGSSSFTLNGATDADGGDITYELVDPPSFGSISSCLGNTSDLTCVYTPDINSSAPASVSFTYRARDSISTSKTVSTVTIVLNEPPVMVGDQAFTTQEDYPLEFNLSGATDSSNDSLFYNLTSLPTAGTLTNCLGNTSDLSCLYSPPKNFNGAVSFTYVANDGYVVATKTSKVTITVTPVNDPPELIGDQTENLIEDTPYKFNLKGAIDPEGSSVTYSIVSAPSSGVLTGCAQGNGEVSCSYQPQKDFNGPVTFTYKANDGELDSSSVSTVTLNISPVNDAPVAGEDSFIQGYVDSRTTFEVNKATDADSANLNYSVVKDPSNGTLMNCFSSIGKRSCEYLPNSGFQGSDYFTYRVSDGELYSRTVTVIINIDQKILPSIVVQLASGDYHTCALLNNGQVRCWGSNEFGQLGHENTTIIGNKASPYNYIFQAGSVDLGGTAIEIAAGKNHTCALLDMGRVRCWGANQQGQAGYSIFSSLGDEIGEAPSILGDVPLDGHVIHISAGYYNTCAILINGEIRCWGSFGTGSNVYVSPVNSTNLEINGNVKALASGFKHTCALLDNGAVKCWSGDGTLAEGPSFGELGYNNKKDVGPKNAADVSIGGKVIQLASKGNHNCALLENKKVRCWGANFMGQLGLGITSNVGDGVGPSISQAGDVQVGADVKHIAVGVHHSCAVLSTGDVRCWGRGVEGQLGYGGSEERIGDNEFPSTISTVDLGGRAVATTLGLYSSCALLESGQVRCWGFGANARGALGYGNDDNIGIEIPPRVAGDLTLFDPLSITVNAGVAKSTRAFDLLRLNGAVAFENNIDAPKIIWDKIFGPNGTLFENNSHLNSKVRFSVPGDYILRLKAITEGKVSQDTVKISVSKNFLNPLIAGDGHSCFINLSGNLECVGDNIFPGPVVGNSTVVTNLSELVDFNSRKSIHCAVDTQGLVYCWGASFGTGRASFSSDYTYEKRPVFGITDAIQVATGNATACALMRSGTVQCWGLYDASSYGTLGDGLGLDSIVPVNVLGITNAEKIVMGDHYGCALLLDKTVKCWGEAAVPDQYLSFYPQTVTSLQDIVDISAGDFHACAVNSSGNLFCWGLLNTSGEQGSGSTKSTAPGYHVINIANVFDAVQVAAGLDYTCYLKIDQTVKCFGNNQYGQLGNGTTTFSLTPVIVSGLQNIVHISGGAQHVCAISQDQINFCWGKNDSKQIENSNNLKITKPVRVFNSGGSK